MKSITLIPIALLLVTGLPAQGLFKKMANAAANAVTRPSGTTTSSTSPQPTRHAIPRGDTTTLGPRMTPRPGSTPTSAAVPPTDQFPAGIKRQVLLQLDAGETILTTESSVLITPGHTAGDVSFTYTLITKKDKQFYITTAAGKKGPYDKLTDDILPDRKKGSHLSSNITQLQPVGPDQFKEAMKHITFDFSGDDPTIFVDKKKITTVPKGSLPGSYIYDEATGKYAVIVNSYDAQMHMHSTLYTNTGMKWDPAAGAVNIMVLPATSGPTSGSGPTSTTSPTSAHGITSTRASTPTTGFWFVTTDASRQQTLLDPDGKPLLSFSDQVFVTADQKTFVTFLFEKGTPVVTNSRQDRWSLDRDILDNRKLSFSQDGSRWMATTDEGLRFSDGSKVRSGIMPVLRKEGDRSSLHFLTLTPDHEVVACSLDW